MKDALERSLRKQQCLRDIQAQRDALARHAAGLAPLCDLADRGMAGVRWATHHPEIVAGSLALLAAARPGVRRFFWRWGRRAFVVWQLWGKHRPLPSSAWPRGV